MPKNNSNNTTLIKKLKAGDRVVYKELYLLYYAKLNGIGKKFNFNLLSPEDFVHETFLKLYNNRKLLKEDVLLDKQLFVICKNIILNHIKKEKRHWTIDNFDSFLETEDIHSETPSDKENELLLNGILKTLPKKQEEIFRLHKLSGYSYNEIEQITGLSKKTIANHIYLATKFLKENAYKSAIL